MSELQMHARSPVIVTARLTLREITTADAEFILRLVNEPSFLQFIGDRNVRNTDDARIYIESAHRESYRAHGFGAYLVERKSDAEPLGICGLMRKPWLDAPDIAYAFLPGAGGQGYAQESASAVMEFAQSTLRLKRIVAVVVHENERSIRLLHKLGFIAHGTVVDPRDNKELRLFAFTQK